MARKNDPGVAITLPIRLLDPDLPVPYYATPGAAAFDLACRQTCTIAAFTEALVPLGVVVQVPPGHALFISARSSTLRRRGLLVGNSPGIVDPDFNGDGDEVCAVLYNTRSAPVIVERGERLVQAYILPVPRVEFTTAIEHMANRGGFGSTGT